ncbi:hypothetical protein CYMTET_19091 [Cymbomonas tetramitiformis]|uniref:Uncharacterized protein n=1 Tax=Cymbomonas tetramitiformis TaxID=36881 RepID=A0AAE0G759_9CHLO|nr:hypothetical protein CYMTET_19091 [Cymbomonas tetramitiformis]|eukprot:gene17042-20262_t
MATIDEGFVQRIEQKVAIDAEVAGSILRDEVDSEAVSAVEEVAVNLEALRAQSDQDETVPTPMVDEAAGADRDGDNGVVVENKAAEDFVVADVDAISIAISPRNIQAMDDAVKHPF